jgi:dihydroorotate dehydrogenase electron transfer subunit
MPAPPADARSHLTECVSVEPCGDDGVILRVRTSDPLATLRAGRFFMLSASVPGFPAIPRPFSVYRQDGSEMEFLIKIMGRGTRMLSELEPGTAVRATGALGNGWPELDAEKHMVMLAGGIGSAPFFMLIEQALARGLAASDMTLIYGAAIGGLLYDIERFADLGVRVVPATDDGSMGFHGNALQALHEEWGVGAIPTDCRLLACGPDPMLHAVERLARERELECWLSLEGLMGCGVGICNGCPVPTRLEGGMGDWPNAKSCVEGPVFSVADVTL